MRPLSSSAVPGASRPAGRLFAIMSLIALLMAFIVPAAFANNSGTVKVDGDQDQNHPDNQPHVPCQFSLEFFQFQAETVHVDFAAQQPSGDVHILSDTVTLNPSGEDGEEPTFNGTKGYDFTGLLDGLERHPQQGYHIKVTVEEDPANPPAKHKVFWIDCPEPEPAEASLTVAKVVTGDDAPAAGTQFGITLVCDGTTVSFTLAHGESTTWAAESDVDLAEGDECTLQETDDHGATTVTVEFNGTTVEQGATVTLTAGSNGYVVTNDFPDEGPLAANLLVDKVVTGDGAPDATTEFTIEVTCDDISVTAMLTGGDAPWSWNDDSGESDLTDESVCSVEETDAQGADTVTVTFNGVASDELADEELGEGDNTFVVTNDFPAEGDVGGVDVELPVEQPAVDVGPDVVEGAPAGEQPAVADEQPAAAQDVADDQVTARELPATGASNTVLLLLALTLIGFGGLAVRQADARVRAS